MLDLWKLGNVSLPALSWESVDKLKFGHDKEKKSNNKYFHIFYFINYGNVVTISISEIKKSFQGDQNFST